MDAHLNKISRFLFTIPFIFSGINILFFYFGLANNDNIIRKIGFIACALISFILTIIIAKRNNLFNTNKILLFIIPLILFFVYALALYKFGFNSIIIFRLEQTIIMSIPAYILGYMCMKFKKEFELFKELERLSILFIPSGFIYILFSYIYNPWDRNLGYVSYMSFSYILMPLMYAIFINLLQDSFSYRLVQFRGRQFKISSYIRIATILLFWIDIIISKTRGAIFGTMVFLITIFIFTLFKRINKKIFIKTISLILSFFIIYFAPQFISNINFSVKDRSTSFINDFIKGDIKTSDRGRLTDEQMIFLVNGTNPLDSNDTVITNTNLINSEKKVMNIGDRISIYKLAYAEFKENKITGMGPFGFQIKYGHGLYPHNFILELLAELGIIFGGILILGIFYLFVRVVILSKKNDNVALMLVFIFGYSVRIFVSGSVWSMPILMFFLGYAICIHANVYQIDKH